jgi:hypothetical protein
MSSSVPVRALHNGSLTAALAGDSPRAWQNSFGERSGGPLSALARSPRPDLGSSPLLPPGNLNVNDVPSFIIFDCTALTKIDATAARTCFLQLQRISAKHSVCIAYARLTPAMEVSACSDTVLTSC